MNENFKTKNELVYESLRSDILDGKLQPGERIVISNISKRFGFSDIPIREAMKRLQSEGLLEITPHVGIKVTKIYGNDFVGIFLMLIELEALAAKLATPHLVEDDLNFLEQNIREMELAVKQKDLGRLAALNREFHFGIYKAVPYTSIFNLIVSLYEKTHRGQTVFVLVPRRASTSVKEHKKILAAIKNKNFKLAGRLTRSQKKKSVNKIINFLTKKQHFAEAETLLPHNTTRS